MGTISNGKNTPINVKVGTVPNMTGALANWFQPLTFQQIVKTTVDFQLVETTTPIEFRGVVQPLSGRQLMMKPEGQRDWNWILVHSDTSLKLRPDDRIVFLNIKYRVMGQKNYSLYGYLSYELAQDYTGSDPA